MIFLAKIGVTEPERMKTLSIKKADLDENTRYCPELIFSMISTDCNWFTRIYTDFNLIHANKITTTWWNGRKSRPGGIVIDTAAIGDVAEVLQPKHFILNLTGSFILQFLALFWKKKKSADRRGDGFNSNESWWKFVGDRRNWLHRKSHWCSTYFSLCEKVCRYC